MRSGADAVEANGSQVNSAPRWNGSSAIGTQAPEQMAWTTARAASSTQGPRSIRTISTVQAMSMAIPIVTASTRLTTNSPRCVADAGSGSTPRRGASISSGAETSSMGRAQSPIISAAYWVASGIGQVNRVAIAPFHSAPAIGVRTLNCAENTSATSEYVSTVPSP